MTFSSMEYTIRNGSADELRSKEGRGGDLDIPKAEVMWICLWYSHHHRRHFPQRKAGREGGKEKKRENAERERRW